MKPLNVNSFSLRKYLSFLLFAGLGIALLMNMTSCESDAGQNVAMEANEAKVDNEVYEIVEEMPEFPGGMGKMMAFLGNNIEYPQEARDAAIAGPVVVSFIVEKDGAISDVQIVKEIGGGCGAEALRVVKEMPNWIPGKQSGENVRVKFNLPVRFELE